jgi:hypothetical protein
MVDILHKVGIKSSSLETGKGAPWPNEIKLDSWE